MGALDRLANFSGKPVATKGESVFDVKTPAGAFLQQVHNNGYNMYEPCYKLKDEFRLGEDEEMSLSGHEAEQYGASLEISQETFDAMSPEMQEMYDKSFRYTELHNVLTTDGNQIVNAVAGSGKALVNGTKVLTNKGYRCIEKLKVGDLVFGEDGKLHLVQGVFPQGYERTYIVTFSDGHRIPCSGNHLWEIEDLSRGDDVPPQILTTEEILQTIPLQWLDKQYSCRVPVASAYEFDVEPVCSINPYILGYILVAGVADVQEVLIHVNRNASLNKIAQRCKAEWSIVQLERNCYQIFSEVLKTQLMSLGVFAKSQAEMSIPTEYLHSSKANRLALLRGILDAAADLSERSDLLFFESKRFADDLEFLCESLGLVVSVPEIDGKYGLYVYTENFSEILNSDRSVNEILYLFSCKSERFITSIEKTEEMNRMTCICVDSPRRLYITEHGIVTHNTTMLVFKILHDIVTGRCMTVRELDNGMRVRVANKVWVCTFLKSGAEELEAALTNWQYKLGYSQTAPMLSFSTMDAEFKRCLNAMGVDTPLDEGSKLYSLMVKAIDSCNIKRNGYSLTKEDYGIIGGIITYYRGRLDDSKYNHPSCKEYELTPTILDLVVKQFANLRAQAGIMDFAEIMELLYKYLYVTPNAQVQEFVANRYNFIYIDEFQDTSQMAYAILKFYARGKLWLNRSGATAPVNTPAGLYTGHETLGKFVVVGDTAQCLLPDVQIRLLTGEVIDAKEVKKGYCIQTVVEQGQFGYLPVDEVTENWFSGNICKIDFAGNQPLKVTEDHKCFVRIAETEKPDIELVMFGGVESSMHRLRVIYPNGHESRHDSSNVEDLEELLQVAVNKFDKLGQVPIIHRCAMLLPGEKFRIVAAKDVMYGDIICVYDDATKSLRRDVVLGVDIHPYDGYVYDFNIAGVRNFVANNIVVHNCIYSFRGSDSNILATEVEADFHPTISSLSVNWRCPDKILDPVVPSIHRNWDSADQNIQAANKGGELFAYAFKNYNQMIQQLKLDIQKDMDDGMKVAILCRTNFDGLIPAVVLEQDGRFNFSVSGENMTMNSPLPRKLIGATALFTERATPAVKNTLLEFAGRTNRWAVEDLVKVLKNNNKSFWDIPEADIKYSCPVLLDLYRDIKPLIFVNGVRDKAREVEALQVVYFKLMTDTYAGDSAYCESARAYLETLLFILEHGNFKSVYEFLEEIEYLNDKLNGRIKKKKVYVQIATVHEFKGKEADSVYIWNDNDGVFPYSKCNLQIESELNEERRVHYIACTRAKKREYIYSIAGRVGMFAREMSLKFTNPVPVGAKLQKKEQPLPEEA